MTEQRDPPLASTTVLDRVRPTVVRRRVYETAELRPESAAATAATRAPEPEEESAPPSSVDVARAPEGEPPGQPALLAGEAEEPSAPSAPAEPSTRTAPRAAPEPMKPEPRRPRTLVVGRSIQVAELARRMSVALEELVEVLVECGFFSTTAKTALRRESVRSVVKAFGWQVEGPPADVLLEHMSSPAV